MSASSDIFDREIGINDVLFFLWRKRKKLALATFFWIIIGVGYALLQKNEYQSEAIIAVPEDKKNSGAGFGLGGAFASQLGLGGSGLANLQTIVEGRAIAKRVIKNNNLLPYIYPTKWDADKGMWSEEWDPEKMCETEITECAADLLRKKWLNISLDSRRDQLRIRIATNSRELSKAVVSYYLVELNLLLREAAVKSAEANRSFLYEQLSRTDDPTLRQGILDYVSREIVRSTILRSEAFEVLQEPSFPIKRYKPNRRQIVLLFAIMGFAISVGGLFFFEYVISLKRAWTRVE